MKPYLRAQTPNVLRLNAAYAHFVARDEGKARELLAQAKVAAERLPVAGHRAMEMDYAQRLGDLMEAPAPAL